ncbi:MAG: AsnC family transcriptional regulator [Nitrososphaerota archaeon]|nr:AsnC family transcriptional regulator [Nitrososphaerota archaeon]
MDRVDVAILRWFLQGHQTAPFRPEVRPNISILSKRLGVSAETVRNRMRRLFETGVLNGVVGQPNPEVLGLQIAALGIQVPPETSRHKLARSLALVEGMQIVATHLDGMIGLVFFHEGGASLERKLKLVKTMSGATEAMFTEVVFPPCDLELKRADWEILAALRPDASQSYHELAKKTRLSARTVKRRLDRMVSGMALFTMALHETRAVSGSLEANVVVQYEPGADRSAADGAIMKVLEDNLFYAGVWARYSVYAISIPNLVAAEEAERKLMQIRGVKDAKASIIEERLELYDSLDQVISSKLRGPGSESRPPARSVAVVQRARKRPR